ncbi:AMP-binding protein [Amycolatopsis sp. K13G38]|uniref:AMP-binding protein n=1 Tax=Amycolatopsis acididurans TaxID=2724524 RepID=A0ABX1IYR8_9PSEU|nr:AMP-binding protein [Amycolatopsis acididurans]NKQ51879.1 AMP-binding protein [Amycolatopsis acididurans]
MSQTTVRDRYSDEEIRAFYAARFWRQEGLFELVETQARRHGEKVFATDATTSLTYTDLRERGERLAAGLAGLGVGAGDRIAVQLPNWTEFLLIAVATARLGAILVPIMPIYRAGEVGYVVRHSGAKVAITCEEFKGFRHLDMFAGLRESCPDLDHLVVVRGTGAVRFEDLLAAPAGNPGDRPSPDDAFLIVYTSGTTSRPKGCFHTFNTVRASAAAIARSVGYDEHDVQFGPSPVTHSTGLVTSLVLPLLAGASSHLMEVWEPHEGWQRIAKHGCTVAVTATPFLQMLMAAYDQDRHDASSLRVWVCAGSPIPGAIVRRAGEQFPGCRVLSLYGRSENFLTTMCTVDDPPERSATSDGSAIAGAAVKVVDELGAEVPRGTEGDIAYRGPSHMLGYYRDPEQTQALFTPDGFSRSGDLGVMDDDGYVRVTGRLKDIIIRGGLNISARELEELLAEHPAVASVAVVGMPDERLGERVCACVVPTEGARPALEDLTGYLRERDVATPKLPERLELLGELPMTATGKVRKHVLRDEIARKSR